jgi:hypothetical protein
MVSDNVNLRPGVAKLIDAEALIEIEVDAVVA